MTSISISESEGWQHAGSAALVMLALLAACGDDSSTIGSGGEGGGTDSTTSATTTDAATTGAATTGAATTGAATTAGAGGEGGVGGGGTAYLIEEGVYGGELVNTNSTCGTFGSTEATELLLAWESPTEMSLTRVNNGEPVGAPFVCTLTDGVITCPEEVSSFFINDTTYLTLNVPAVDLEILSPTSFFHEALNTWSCQGSGCLDYATEHDTTFPCSFDRKVTRTKL